MLLIISIISSSLTGLGYILTEDSLLIMYISVPITLIILDGKELQPNKVTMTK